MQTRSKASGRFFQAFYQWSLITSKPGHDGSRRAMSSSGTYLQNVEQDTHAEKRLIRKHWSLPSNPYDKINSEDNAHRATSPTLKTVVTPAPQQSPLPTNAVSQVSPPLPFQRRPIQSSSDLPVVAMKPWQIAVRSRSSDSLTLEVAISKEGLQRLQEKYGLNLEGLFDRVGKKDAVVLKINVTAVGLTPTQSIMISGPAVAVKQFHHMIFEAKNTNGHIKKRQEHKADPASSMITQQSDSNSDSVVEGLRTTLRTLTHPVVLITSRSKPTKPSPGGQPSGTEAHDPDINAARGVTVSSFTTVTLQPVPVISFNIRVPSRTWDAIKSSGFITAHILAASDEGAAIAHAFTQPYEDPSQPFRVVKAMGAIVTVPNNAAGPPNIIMANTVMARIEAKVVWENCVPVGDHRVILGEVIKCEVPASDAKLGDEIVALSYGRQGYRSGGKEIVVPRLPVVEDPQDMLEIPEKGLSENTAESQMATDSIEVSAATTSSQHGEVHEAPVEEGHMAPGTAANEVTSKTDIQSVILSEPNQETEGKTFPVDAKMAAPSTAGNNEIPLIPRVLTPDSTKPVACKAWGLQLGKRNYSSCVLTRPACPQRTIGMIRSSIGPQRYASSAAPDFPGHSLEHVDPKVLRLTVGEFVCLPDSPSSWPRVAELLRLKKRAAWASGRLEKALKYGTSTADEIRELETSILMSERRVAKKLALQAAADLSRVLESGRSNWEGIGWLESTIEKGLVVLIEEAKQIRWMYDRKQLSEEQFESMKSSLQEDNETLETELTGLRALVEDELDEGSLEDDDY